mmetsp:Transcript_11144/g.16443  ORF Transcript_11144/g.16443 Transcript_11144/m.16443 type:complete len:1196 (-) Transcript_11144:2334-5921(-)
MDPHILKNLVDASLAAMQGNSEAVQFLEEFKNQCNDLLSYAFELIKKTCPPPTRSYGYQLIEYFLKHRWFNSQQWLKEKFITTILGEMRNRDKLDDLPVFMEKISTVVVEVMKREWPQNMPQILDDVVKITDLGYHHSQFFFRIMRRLCEDASTILGQDLVVQRKAQLVASLRKECEQKLYDHIKMIHTRAYNEYKSAQSVGNMQMVTNLGTLLELILETEAAMMTDWASLKKIFHIGLPDLWNEHLGDPTLAAYATKPLRRLCDLSWSIIDQNKITSWLQGYIDISNQVMQQTSQQPVQYYQVHKDICIILSKFIQNNMTRLFSKGKNTRQKLKVSGTMVSVIESVMNLLLNLSRLPSLNITLILRKAWKKILNTDYPIVDMDLFKKGLVKPILEMCFHKMLKEIGNPENIELFSNIPLQEVSMIEYGDAQDYVQEFVDAREALRFIVKSVTKISPILAIDCSNYLLSIVVPKRGPQPDEPKDDIECCTEVSMSYLQWESAATMLRWVTQSIPGSQETNVQVVEQLQNGINMVGEFRTRDPLIQSQHVQCFACYDALYQKNPNILETVLQRLFDEFQFVTVAEENRNPDTPLRHNTKIARKMAHTVFLAIVKKLSHMVDKHLEHMTGKAINLHNEKRITMDELVLIFESLVLIANSKPNSSDVGKLMQFFLDARMNEIEQDQNGIRTLSSDIPGLETTFVTNPQSMRQQRDQILFTLNIVTAAAKSGGEKQPVKNQMKKDIMQKPYQKHSWVGKIAMRRNFQFPVGPYLIHTMHFARTLVNSIHSFYEPQSLQRISQNPVHHQKVYMSHYDQIALSATGKHFDFGRLSPVDQEIYNDNLNLKKLKISLYELYGYSAKYSPQSFYVEGVVDMLNQSIFHCMDNLPMRDVSYILELFFKKFVRYCPENLYQMIFPPIMMQVYTELLKRVDLGWRLIISQHNGDPPPQGVNPAWFLAMNHPSDEHEIIQEAIMAHFSYHVLDIPMHITECLATSLKATNPQMDGLCRFLFTQVPIMELMLGMSARILFSPDVRSVRRVINFLDRVVPHLSANPAYDNVIAGEILNAATHAAMTFDSAEHDALVKIITHIYVTYRAKHSTIPQAVFSKLEVNGARPSEIALSELDSQLYESSKKKKAKKDQRVIMRKFLEPLLGAHSGEFTTDIVKIQKLDSQNNTNRKHNKSNKKKKKQKNKKKKKR